MPAVIFLCNCALAIAVSDASVSTSITWTISIALIDKVCNSDMLLSRILDNWTSIVYFLRISLDRWTYTVTSNLVEDATPVYHVLGREMKRRVVWFQDRIFSWQWWWWSVGQQRGKGGLEGGRSRGRLVRLCERWTQYHLLWQELEILWKDHWYPIQTTIFLHEWCCCH